MRKMFSQMRQPPIDQTFRYIIFRKIRRNKGEIIRNRPTGTGDPFYFIFLRQGMIDFKYPMF